MAATRPVHTHTAEQRTAFLLAIGMMAALLFVAGHVVLCDMSILREKIETLFQLDMDAPELTPTAQTYAEGKVDDLTKNVLRGKSHQLFSGLPGAANESPAALHPGMQMPQLAPQLPAAASMQESRPKTALLDTPGTTPELLNLEQSVPVMHVRKVGRTMADKTPDLRRLYAEGKVGGGGLGLPGETFLSPRAQEMPAAPSERTMAAVLPGTTEFHLPDSVGSLTRRLVAARPPKGYPSLDRDIQATFTVYRKPGDASAYFQLTLALRPESRVPTIPKDVLFLVDVSQSISTARLNATREAVVEQLDLLPPGDRWNVVVFSEGVYYLHDQPFFATRDMYDEGMVRSFVDRRARERRTNIYEATRLIFSRIPQSDRPCLVVLLSDGLANTGSSDVHWIVNDFQRINRENFSVFPVNTGEKRNLYLLSLLAYRSRGMLFDTPGTSRVDENVGALMSACGDPVLTNVVASYTNIKTEDVYPEVLPSLYRHNAITFWGRTTPGREVALRVAGQSKDGPREFFFRAKVPAGDATHTDVVRGWARGKAHALIAQLADDPTNAALRERALSLAVQYGLADIQRLLETGRSWLRWRR